MGMKVKRRGGQDGKFVDDNMEMAGGTWGEARNGGTGG